MGILKQMVDMYKAGDKVAILYSTTSGRTSMIYKDAYEIEEYHNMLEHETDLENEKEIIVDSAEHLEYAEVRRLANLPGKVILLFDQVGGINGLTIDQLRTLGFVILIPPENIINAAGADVFKMLKNVMYKVLSKESANMQANDKIKTKIVQPSKLKNPLIISNDYNATVYMALHKDMKSISKLTEGIDGIGKKTAAGISAIEYKDLGKYAESLKGEPQKQIKHMINAIDNEDAYMLSKLTGKQITLKDALFGKAIGIKGANARRHVNTAFFHTFDEVLVDLKRYEFSGSEEYDESYAIRIYYAMTRATGAIAFSENVDKTIMEIEKIVSLNV